MTNLSEWHSPELIFGNADAGFTVRKSRQLRDQWLEGPDDVDDGDDTPQGPDIVHNPTDWL